MFACHEHNELFVSFFQYMMHIHETHTPKYTWSFSHATEREENNMSILDDVNKIIHNMPTAELNETTTSGSTDLANLVSDFYITLRSRGLDKDHIKLLTNDYFAFCLQTLYKQNAQRS